MPRIKIFDLPPASHFSQKLIQRRLTAFLKEFKAQRRTEPQDQDATGKRHSRTAEKLTWTESNRLDNRVKRLIKVRKTAAGMHHLSADELASLLPLESGAETIALPTTHRADEIAAHLHEDMPWFALATELVWHDLRACAAAGRPVVLRPLLLNGPPGIGKSHWARRLSELLGVPSAELDAGKAGAGFAIVGTERGWGTAQPGRPVELLVQHRIANPLILVDEICKSGMLRTSRGVGVTIANALLSLMEGVSAKKWECPYHRVTFDMTHISWVMTSNTLETVPAPLASRCRIVDLPALTSQDLSKFAERRAAEKGLSNASLEAIITALETATARGGTLSLPDVQRMIDRAAVLEARPLLH